MTLLPDVETAMSWLNSFAFVGMTDDYSRSVCLSHAMFPTPRRAVSRRRVPEHKPNGLQQLDPTDKAKGSAANQFYPDEYDSRVWARAKEIYTLSRWSNIGSHECGANQFAPVLQGRGRRVEAAQRRGPGPGGSGVCSCARGVGWPGATLGGRCGASKAVWPGVEKARLQ